MNIERRRALNLEAVRRYRRTSKGQLNSAADNMRRTASGKNALQTFIRRHRANPDMGSSA